MGGWGIEEALLAGADKGGEVSVGVEFADGVVAAVGDVEISLGVKGKAGGGVELAVCAVAVAPSSDAIAGKCGDLAAGVEETNAVSFAVGDVEVSVGGACESCGGNKASV